ncbi:MAG: Tat pathway signal sequence [Raoultibacter sp.]
MKYITRGDTVGQKSGIDTLIDVLRQSGMPVDVGGFSSSAEDVDPVASSSDGAGGKGSSSVPPKANIEVPFSDKIASWGKRALIIALIVALIVAAVAYWWFHPAINIQSTDTWFFVGVFVLLPLFLVFIGRSMAYKNGTAKLTASEGKAKVFKGLSWIPIAVIVLGIVGAAASVAIFPGNAEKYANVLQTTNLNFTEDIHEVDYSEIPVIDRDSAVLLGNRTMGSIPEYVSQFEISPLYSQINYKGAPVRVSPLVYADLFKWFTNREAGIPAYVVVDMATQNTEIVRLEQPILYSESEPLARNIDRHVQLSYPFYMFDEKSFEIDDQGKPWWVCPVQKRTIGLFGGTTISRVVLCDATTGETQDLPVEECPQWVDRVYPAEMLLQQYNWSGAYQDGWINSVFGQQGVVQTTPGGEGQLGYNYIAKDDDVWVYTGVTSATADSSIVGFVLINQRTAESHFYAMAGATEASAMASAEGQVQNLRYKATFPLLLNINGQPTYFMALKDDAGLVKQYAMLDIQRYQNVAVGDTVAACQKSYKTLLATNGVINEAEGAGAEDVTGVIKNITQAVVEGNSHFYLTLVDDARIFDCAFPGLIEVVGYAPGETITLHFTKGEPTSVVLSIGAKPAAPAAPAAAAAGGGAAGAPATPAAAPAPGPAAN